MEAMERFLLVPVDVVPVVAGEGEVLEEEDNFETNLAIARRSCIHFMGCHSHRLNLDVKLFLLPDEGLLEKVNSLMIALSTKKNCGRLRAQNCVTMPLRRFLIRSLLFIILCVV